MTHPPDDVYLVPRRDSGDAPDWSRGVFFASRATALEIWPDCPCPHKPARYAPHEFLADAERRADDAEKKADDIERESDRQIMRLHCALRDLVLALESGLEADIRAARDEAGRVLV
jgi:hypothetical protein